jgi:hypothetical protein
MKKFKLSLLISCWFKEQELQSFSNHSQQGERSEQNLKGFAPGLLPCCSLSLAQMIDQSGPCSGPAPFRERKWQLHRPRLGSNYS